jgi:hypothetical protein
MNGRTWNNHDAKSIFLAYDKTHATSRIEIVMGTAKPSEAPKTPAEATRFSTPASFAPDSADLGKRALKLRTFLERLNAAGLGSTYPAAHAQLALAASSVIGARRQLLAEGKLKTLPGPSQAAADQSYVDTAIKLSDGLEAVVNRYQDSDQPFLRKIHQLWAALENN